MLDTVLYHHVLEELDYPDSEKKLATRQHFMPITVDEWEDAVLYEAALVLVGGGLMTAFRTWNRGRGPASFNRNGSVHHADDGPYSPAHAVRAVLLAHALLRWLDAAVSDGQEPAVA
ncbi:hypothetical protein [Streptomyces sp. NPDC002176]|uniref:hypothetical protein n=1 Tax=Streptomyces sp. NPDC002176 TaxID=3364634 RepID=UPI00384CC1F4